MASDPISPGPGGLAQTHGVADALGVQSDYNRNASNPDLFTWKGPSQDDIAAKRNVAMAGIAPTLDLKAGSGQQTRALSQSRTAVAMASRDPNIQGRIASQQAGQDKLGAYYQNMMAGNGPSVAEQQLQAGQRRANENTLNQALALQATAKGQQRAGAAYNAQSAAARAMADTNIATNEQAAALRAGEQQQAAAGFGNVLNQQQEANLQAAQQQVGFQLGAAGVGNQAAGLGLQAAGQQQDMAKVQADLAMRQNILNQQMGLAYSGQQIQAAQGTGQLNVAQAEDYQRAMGGNQDITQRNTETNTGLVGGVLNAVGGLFSSDMTNKSNITPVTAVANQQQGQSIAPYTPGQQGVGMGPAQGLTAALAQQGGANPNQPNSGITTQVNLTSDPMTKTDVTPAGAGSPDYTKGYDKVEDMKLPLGGGGGGEYFSSAPGSSADALSKGVASSLGAVGRAGMGLAKGAAGGLSSALMSRDMGPVSFGTPTGGATNNGVMSSNFAVAPAGQSNSDAADIINSDINEKGDIIPVGGGGVGGGVEYGGGGISRDMILRAGTGLEGQEMHGMVGGGGITGGSSIGGHAIPGTPGDSSGGMKGGKIFSDKRLKDFAVPGGHTPADSFLEALSKSASMYRYKDPSFEPTDNPHGGKYLGVMAQAVAQTPTGDTLVERTPRGLALNVPANLSAALAGLGRLNERLDAIEDVLPKKKGKKK